ncbi:uncharacterized protein LOC113372668 [Ctenocephalides felis]|nr:uncharacterized protein LOC113372668 [Ctenocephalides felis]
MQSEDDEWETVTSSKDVSALGVPEEKQISVRRKCSIICPIYNDPAITYGTIHRKTPPSCRHKRSCSPLSISATSTQITVERTTQTEKAIPRWKQLIYCLLGNDEFRRQRQREASSCKKERGANGTIRQVNSVSMIDRMARVLFPASFGLLNLLYWIIYVTYQEEFTWTRMDSLN